LPDLTLEVLRTGMPYGYSDASPKRIPPAGNRRRVGFVVTDVKGAHDMNAHIMAPLTDAPMPAHHK